MAKTFTVCTYNIQAAIGTRARSHYFTRLHHQFVQTKTKTKTLVNIAEYVSQFDIVCLQEVDLGGRRAGFECQVETIAALTGHPHVADQENRRVRKISRHGNAILSRFPIIEDHDLKLPGRVTGRGAIMATVDIGRPLSVTNAHLSLGQKDQLGQFSYIMTQLPETGAAIVVGDLNCSHRSPVLRGFSEMSDLSILTEGGHPTYPSWRPRHAYDHILCSSELTSVSCQADPVLLSDHRPVVAKFEM